MSDPTLAFLQKIPDQCGCLVISDGVVIKSDGDLANRESIALVVEKMVAISRSDNIPGGKYQQMTINYGSYLLAIVRSGRYIYVVKRKPSV